LIAYKAGNVWQIEPVGNEVTGLIIGAECNAQRTLSGIPVIIMARVMPIAIN
jgi:hypothetical protein